MNNKNSGLGCLAIIVWIRYMVIKSIRLTHWNRLKVSIEATHNETEKKVAPPQKAPDVTVNNLWRN